MRKLLLLALLLFPSLTMAQYVRYDGIAIGDRGTPVGGASVAVCTQPASTGTQPCSPLASLFSTTSGTTLANPVTADPLGNFHFYAAPGLYTIQIYSPQIQTPSVQADVSVACSISSGCTHSGTETFCNQNGVLYVGGTNPCAFAGSDIGAQINSAYALLPANGGTIKIIPSNSCYSYSTPIAFTTSGKYVLLEAQQPPTIASASLLAGACLNYTPVTATTALTMHFVPTNSGNPPGAFGLRNITLINNMCMTSGGCGSSATGIDGTASSDWGITGAVMEHVTVYGFNFGYKDVTGPILPDAITWYDPVFIANNVAMTHGTVLEVFNDGTWGGNGCAEQAANSANPELYFSKPTLISNNTACNAALDFTNAGSASLLNLFEPHIEAATTGTNGVHHIKGPVHLVIHGGVMEDDATTSTGDWMVSLSGSTGVNIDGLLLSTGGKTYTNVFLINASVRGSINAIIQGSSLTCSSIVGGANAGAITQAVQPASSSTTACQYSIGDSVFKAPIGMGDAAFTPSSGAVLHLRSDVATKDALRLENSGANPRIVDVGPGVGGVGAAIGIYDISGSKLVSKFDFGSDYDFFASNGRLRGTQVVSDQGTACTNGELVLSAGWGTTATVTAVAGQGQTCEWTLTSSGTGQAANPTITDTLTNALPSASVVCEMRMVGGTGTTTLIDQTSLSATAPVFTFGGTPVAASTYKVVRRCGP